jgi:hypothetical protein
VIRIRAGRIIGFNPLASIQSHYLYKYEECLDTTPMWEQVFLASTIETPVFYTKPQVLPVWEFVRRQAKVDQACKASHDMKDECDIYPQEISKNLQEGLQLLCLHLATFPVLRFQDNLEANLAVQWPAQIAEIRVCDILGETR